MYKSLNSKLLGRAGEYDLSQVFIISYSSVNGGQDPIRLNITGLISEINIYEHIENEFISGDMILTDADNILYRLPLTGFERLEFKLYTPGLNKGMDYSVDTGYPMFIYSISERKSINQRTQGYMLHFCSIESIKNHQRRVCKAFSSTIDEMIINILRNDLKTKKNIFIEETKGVTKFTLPLDKPLNTIKTLCKDAQSKNFYNSGYLFFENIYGFHCKSYESLFCLENGTPRKEVAFYTPKVKNERVRNVLNDLQAVEHYTIKSQFNTLKNVQTGTYASRLITVDAFNKTFENTDFNYNVEYGKSNHLEMDPNGGIIDNNGILPYFNFETGKAFSDFSDGTLLFQSNTKKVHNAYDLPDQRNITQRRISQKNAIGSLILEITIPGFTGITVGDIVRFNLPKYATPSKAEPLDNDPMMSGRYLISGIRHQISPINKRHTSVLELIKDSISIPYAEEDTDLFTNNESDNGDNYLQYEMDKLFV